VLLINNRESRAKVMLLHDMLSEMTV